MPENLYYWQMPCNSVFKGLKWTLETKTMKESIEMNYHSTGSTTTLLSKMWQT